MEQSEIKQTAYSYFRISSQQEMKGDSLRRQLELSRKYAAENNLVLDESLTDIGISAWTGVETKFQLAQRSSGECRWLAHR